MKLIDFDDVKALVGDLQTMRAMYMAADLQGSSIACSAWIAGEQYDFAKAISQVELSRFLKTAIDLRLKAFENKLRALGVDVDA